MYGLTTYEIFHKSKIKDITVQS